MTDLADRSREQDLRLVILIGLQASGKTTFRKQYLDATHEVVSKDLMRNVRRKEERQSRSIEEHLSAGRSVVVDNTNPAPEDRAAPIALGRRHGALIVGYFFDTPVGDALKRNALRHGRERVPDVGIFSAARRLKPPACHEGFDELYRVRLNDGGRFDLSRIATRTSSRRS